MTTIEQIITNFKGTTFSSHEDVEKWLRQALEQTRKETISECIKLVGVHTDHDGHYCDTGEDMEWACRSECVDMAIERLANLNNLK